MRTMPNLAKVLDEVRQRIAQASKRGLNEENTKVTLIGPVLRALGWDVENIEEVRHEFRIKKSDKPVDYGLLILRTPRLFIEAKALGSNLDDRRWANQIMGYAAVAGVKWIVLTDGNEYRIYNTHAPVVVDEKLFRSVRITDQDSSVAETLELLAKDHLEENRIEVLWRAQFVDRQVRAALEELLPPGNDTLLVKYVRGKTKNLTDTEIRASLARCQVSLNFPVPIPPPPGKVAVRDLIKAGYIARGAALHAQYKGEILTALVEADGRIKFAGVVYNSLSKAGGAARASVNNDGKFPQTGGWTFWKVNTSSGDSVPIDDLRQRYISAGGAAETAG